MTYNPNFPPPTTSPELSPVQIQTNYAQFATAFSYTIGGVVYNHMPLNDFNQGKHASVLMQNQSGDPGVINNYTVLYSRNATSAATPLGQPQLFSQIPKFLPVPIELGDIPNFPQQMTYNTVNTIGPDQYQSFLPGGYILYFGSTNPISVITLSPTPTKILMVQAVAQINPPPNTNYAPAFTITQPGTINIFSGQPSGKILWLAIAQA
jgi:hypothetical protein